MTALPPMPPPPALLLPAPQSFGADPPALLRLAQPDDAAALRTLYCAARAPEFLPLGLPDAILAGLLDGQFRAQQMGYAAYFPDLATYVLVAVPDEPLMGRLMLARDRGRIGPAALRIVDIMIAAPWRGRGRGGAVLTRVAAAARAAGYAALRLEVAKNNPGAYRLYERLGFEVDAQDPDSAGLHVVMHKLLL